MQYNTTQISGKDNVCQVVLSDSKGEHQFSSGNIIRLQAQDNYTIVYFEKRRPFVVSKVLKTYEELLAPYGFVRTHRSHLVNPSFVVDIDVVHYNILMQDTSVVDLSRRNKTGIKKQLVELLRKRSKN